MTPQDKVRRARSTILLKSVFFGSLLCQTPVVETDAIPTAATDMHKIYWNPAFVDMLTLDETVFLFVHEIMHIVGKHGYRRGRRDAKRFNRACDYFINLFMVNAKYVMPKPPNHGLLDTKYAKMSCEKIDGMLEKEGGGGQGQGQGQGDEPAMSGDLMPAESESTPEAQARMSQIDMQVARAATSARMAGQLSHDLERLVTELLSPKVPWYEMMADYFSDLIEGDVNWGRRNPRVRSAYIPKMDSDPAMEEVIFIGDASGSITDKEFQMIASEGAGCAEMLNPSRFRMVWATSKVVSDESWERGEPPVFCSPESGGTDMRVPLAHVEQYDPAVVVLITDGHTPWPDAAPPYPLIVCCTTDQPVPCGRVVRI